MDSPRLVLLSDHRAHARRLTRVLASRGVVLDAVVLQSASVAPWKSGAAKWARSLVWAARRRLAIERHEKPVYASIARRVVAAGEINSAQMTAILGRLAPDYILVGTSVILKSALIETAKCGVLNVHPGLLPWMRGSGVVGNALQNGVPLGATLHYIDAGIDTGDVIERRLLPVSAPLKLPELEATADELGADLMADWVERILHSGQKPPATRQLSRHPLFKWADDPNRSAQSELCEAGRALELFEAWRGRSSGAPDWVLPAQWMDAPFAPWS